MEKLVNKVVVYLFVFSFFVVPFLKSRTVVNFTMEPNVIEPTVPCRHPKPSADLHIACKDCRQCNFSDLVCAVCILHTAADLAAIAHTQRETARRTDRRHRAASRSQSDSGGNLDDRLSTEFGLTAGVDFLASDVFASPKTAGVGVPTSSSVLRNLEGGGGGWASIADVSYIGGFAGYAFVFAFC